MPKNISTITNRVEKKIKNMIESKLSTNELAEFICQSIRSSKHCRHAILEMASTINPMISEKALILDRNATKNKQARRNAESQALANNHKKELEEQLARNEWLKAEYQKNKESSNEIRWGVQVAPAERKLIFSPKEIKAIIALRREKLSTYKVREILGCTLTEINRWDNNGYLPHAFKQVIQVGGKATESRFWLESEVREQAKNLDDWRKSHELKKSFKRKKNPLKSIAKPQ